jgi:hypothetical protein
MLVVLTVFISASISAQTAAGEKISSDLFGLFFEDINYSADGGLYAEMVQDRSFEYIPAEQGSWNPFSFWEYVTPGFSCGTITVETASPIDPKNPHSVVLTIEHVGSGGGVGLKNSGFNGMVVHSGESYNISLFARQLSKEPISFTVSLQTPAGKILARNKLSTSSKEWKKYPSSLTAAESSDTASLVLLATTKGKLALDVISLFPEKTFKNRPNGLRADLGDVNPGGKLPETFYTSTQQLPPFSEYDLINHPRTYMYFDQQVLYPFGCGIFYTPFEYSNLKLNADKIIGDGELEIRFSVKNAGKMKDDEVAQVYAHAVHASIKVPIN